MVRIEQLTKQNDKFVVIRGRLRPLTKNAVNGTYILVLPIDGIFAECCWMFGFKEFREFNEFREGV